MMVKTFNNEEISVVEGDVIVLNWYGDAKVPKFLTGCEAEVIKILPNGSLRVKALERRDLSKEKLRTILPHRHISCILRKPKKVV